ncbi:MAG: type IV secretory system conjugative DNA transfer family protein, partial [Pseudomonadota bacterium]
QLREIYDTLKDVHERSDYADLEFMQRAAVLVTADVFLRTGAPTDNDRIIDFVGNSAVHLLSREIFFGFATIDWDVPLDLEDTVALRNYLERKRHFLLYAPDIVEQWCERFIDIWVALFKHLPDRMFRAEDDRRGSFDLSTTVIDILDQPAVAIDDLIMAITQHGGKEHGLFEPLDAIIRDNVFIATGIREEDRATSKKPLLFPSKSREPLPRLPEIYLADTPFLDVFSAPVPVDVPDQTRFEHTHVIAGTGHGKTQLIQHLIAQDLDQVAQGEASVVVLDSQGDLIDNISHLDVFARGGPLADRLVLIDPTDVAFPVALNMFDMNTDAPDPLEQEKLLNGVLELYDYIFGSLLGAELTQKQDVIFRYVARLLLLIPGASIQHLLRLMEDGGLEDFAGYIGKLDSPTARAFFETEFNNKDFNATKQQVRRRLWGILENKTFEHMFSSPHSKLRLSDEMNAGKVILINTSKALLKQTGTEIFGRFFVALITQAALERASVPKSERVPTHVYIDEANDYFKGGDQNLPIILEQARKYRISMTLSHQFLDQLDAKLKASFAANTSIKIVGGVSDKDARAMASEMRTTAETIAAMRKFDDHSEFAISVKNVTAGAMRLRVPFGHMEGMPHMTEAQFSAVRDVQREQYCVPVAEIKETLTRQRSGGSFAHTPSDGADADPFGDSYD